MSDSDTLAAGPLDCIVGQHKETLQALRVCCLAWEPDARILGNVRAGDAAAALGDVIREVEILRELIGMAYAHLWMVSNEPGTPHRYPPERAAYEARKLLRDTMTQQQRGEFINRAMATVREVPPNAELKGGK